MGRWHVGRRKLSKVGEGIMNKLVLVVLGVLMITVLAYTFIIFEHGDRIRELEEQIAMQELYYEVKLDYFEERYNIDLDNTPNDFILCLYENYPELHEYLMGVEE